MNIVAALFLLLDVLPSQQFEPGSAAQKAANIASIKQQRGDLDGALTDLNRAIRLDPKMPELYNNRGTVEQKKGDLASALADFNRAIQLDPKFAFGYANRGNIERANRNFDEAIENYNRAINLTFGNDARIYVVRGLAWRAKRAFERARADFNHAILLDPKLAEAYAARASGESDQADFGAAASDYDRAIKLDAKLENAYLGRAHVEKLQGKLDKAAADITEAIEINPRNGAAYNDRGNLRRLRSDFQSALADYNRAIELNRDNSLPYTNRAVVYFLQTDWPTALANFSAAADRSGDQAYSRLQIWATRVQMGQVQAADQELWQYFEHRKNPTNRDWPVRIFLFLHGDITSTNFLPETNLDEPGKISNTASMEWFTSGADFAALAEANTPDPTSDSTVPSSSSQRKLDRGRICEAWFYAGMKSLSTGDRAAAADCFRNAIKSGETSWIEYQLAQAELKFLDGSN